MSNRRKKRARSNEALATRRALKAAIELWPVSGFGVFVGIATSEDGRPFVGFIDRNKRCWRFSGATFAKALERAREWTSRNGARVAEAADLGPDLPHVKRSEAPGTDEGRAELVVSAEGGGRAVGAGAGSPTTRGAPPEVQP